MNYYITAEERLAVKWIHRLKLTHPIDIEAVVDKFADIEYDDLPIDADAILIKDINRPEKKHLIILDRNLHPNRKTFTLAHELGHILIPWHEGYFVCTPSDPENYYAEFEHRQLEAEANRFAGEFLAPREYVVKLFDQLGSPAKVIESLGESKISKLAASFRLVQALPAGFIFAELDNDEYVIRASKTKGTIIDPPQSGLRLDYAYYEKIGADIEFIPGLSSLIWIDVRMLNYTYDKPTDSRNSAEILEFIGKELNLSKEQTKSISSMVGACYGAYEKSGLDIYTVLKHRFKDRDYIREIIDHPDFDRFLYKRSLELEAGWSAKRARGNR